MKNRQRNRGCCKSATWSQKPKNSQKLWVWLTPVRIISKSLAKWSLGLYNPRQRKLSRPPATVLSQRNLTTINYQGELKYSTGEIK
jgi:hypothetical protein